MTPEIKNLLERLAPRGELLTKDLDHQGIYREKCVFCKKMLYFDHHVTYDEHDVDCPWVAARKLLSNAGE